MSEIILKPATKRLIQDIKSQDTKLWQILNDLSVAQVETRQTSLSTVNVTTVVSGTNDERTLHSFDIPAGTLQAGDIIKISGTGILSGPTGSTINVRIKLGEVIGTTGDRVL
jgi:hypothetical protein